MRLDECLRKEDDVIWIWILASLIGSLFARLGGKTQKYPSFSHSYNTWKRAIIGRVLAAGWERERRSRVNGP